jgi:hypothetical protein
MIDHLRVFFLAFLLVGLAVGCEGTGAAQPRVKSGGAKALNPEEVMVPKTKSILH